MSESESSEQSGGITRRQVMGTLGGGAIGAIALPRTPRGWQLRESASVLMTPAQAPTFTATVTRREDMLQLTFEFWNLHLEATPTGPVLLPVDPNGTSMLVAVFGPQTVGEQAFPAPPPQQPAPPPIGAELSGPTRLVFIVPKSLRLRYTLGDLLGWTRLIPALPIKWPTPPEPFATSIEAPWHLFLAPDKTGRWNHSATPVTAARRTELWHTRLGVNHSEPPAAFPALNAIWTPGYPSSLPANPFLMSLLEQDRADIVTNTRTISPAIAELFLLSALGASIKMRGDWPSAPTNLIGWKHRAALGRDSYVRTVRSGFVFPFGNRAVMVSVTDREVQLDNATQPTAHAYLIRRSYVFITQPTISYDGDPNEPFAGRQNPLRTVTFTTLSTPTLDTAGTGTNAQSDKYVYVGTPGGGAGSVDPARAFWIRADFADVPFAAIGTDREGRQLTMHVPLIFVAGDLTGSELGQVVTGYQADSLNREAVPLHGQPLALAEPDPSRPGATSHHLDTLTLAGLVSLSPGPTTPNFYPAFTSADLHLPGVEQLVGSTFASSTLMEIYGYNPTGPASGYLANGFAPGQPEVYLQLAANGQAGLGVNFPPQMTGGTATPNLTISGLARDLGPVAGSLDNLAQGTFNPADFFHTAPQNAAKLLGGITLADIIKSTSGSVGTQAPTISTETIYQGSPPNQEPMAVQTTMDWTPAVQTDGRVFLPVISNPPAPGVDTALTIHVKIYTPVKNSSQTTYDIHGQLTNFSLQLFGGNANFLQVDFDQLDFTSATGAKTAIVPKIRSVEFLDQLSFLNDLRSLLTSLGGISIDIEPTFITATYSLAIPSVGIGIFGLENLKLATALTIPFDNSPVRLRFDLSTRDDPFILSLSLFAGGGFFGLTIGADSIEKLEVSLEFGAAVSLDIGVASGSISIMAGIYFSMQTNPDQVNLTGFLRADGSLTVLGIITISVEFYLGLTYLSKGKAYGEATVTVSVSVFCFSQSVDLTMQKQIGGSGDPTFGQAISRPDWATYCAAFA